MKKELALNCEKPLLGLEDFMSDKSLSVIGVVADKHQGKSNMLYSMIDIIKRNAPDTNVVGFRLFVKIPGVLMLNSLVELAKIRDSYIFVDELKTIVSTDNRKEVDELLKLLQTIRHANNTIVLSGLAHNFNGKLSGEIDAWIFKQTTVISVVKRSNLDYVLKELGDGEQQARMNKYVLAMPKDGALIYHPYMTKNWHYINVSYLEECDTKKDNQPVIKWLDKRNEPPIDKKTQRRLDSVSK